MLSRLRFSLLQRGEPRRFSVDARPDTLHREECDESDLETKPFVEHLDDLRTVLVRALIGIALIYAGCAWFALPLWDWVHAPLLPVLAATGAKEISYEMTEQWSILYLWTPLLATAFLAAPWVAYQAWSFVAPGLYRRERRWVAGFLWTFAGLFVAGGAFGYYVLLPSSAAFLLGIGGPLNHERFVTLTSYLSTFVNVSLGSALAFEAPIVVLALTMMGLVTPAFLLRNVRYVVLGIALVAAVVTPSPNPFDMALVGLPLFALFLFGVLASHIVLMQRDFRRSAWFWVGTGSVVAAGAYAAYRYRGR